MPSDDPIQLLCTSTTSTPLIEPGEIARAFFSQDPSAILGYCELSFVFPEISINSNTGTSITFASGLVCTSLSSNDNGCYGYQVGIGFPRQTSGDQDRDWSHVVALTLLDAESEKVAFEIRQIAP